MRLFRRVAALLAGCAAFGASAMEAPESFTAQYFVLSADITTDPINVELTNYITGATAFYDQGIYGQNVKVANVELGVYWPSHSFLANSTLGETYIPSTATLENLYDSHATGTAAIISGYNSDSSQTIPYYMAFGMAPLSTISAGAVATYINPDGSADIETADFCRAYKYYIETSPQDVINSSWGPNSTNADSYMAFYMDAILSKNASTTFVVAAGNVENAGENTVQSLALAYNGITVGALGNSYTYDTIASYSGRGASDFYNPITDTIISKVRASVDITAPGDNIVVAAYVSTDPTTTDYYSISSGTSFAAPLVSGVATLLKSTSYVLEANSSFTTAGWSSTARDSTVIKAVILNSASKPVGWDNGQSVQNNVEFTVEIAQGAYYTTTYNNVVVTTQGLDYTYGAGILNGDAALDQYINYITTGDKSKAWVSDTVSFDASKMYDIGSYDAGEIMTATLAWLVQSELVYTEAGGDVPDIDGYSFSNLRLELWTFIDGGYVPVAVSDAEYNNVEHLTIALAATGEYYLRVAFFEMLYGSQSEETYALAWSVVPEVSSFASVLGIAAMFAAAIARRNRKK